MQVPGGRGGGRHPQLAQRPTGPLSPSRMPWRDLFRPVERRSWRTSNREAPNHLSPARRGPVTGCPAGAWDVPDPRRPAVLSPTARTPRPWSTATCVSTPPGSSAWWDRWPAACGRRGVRHGDIVTWQLPNWWEALVLFRACWRCGAVAAPIHHQVGAAEVARVLADLETGAGPEHARPPPGRSGRRHRGAQGDARFDDLVGGRPLPVGGGPGVGHRCRAVHLGIDREPQGGAPHPPGPGLQGPVHDPGPRAHQRRRGSDAVALGPRVRPAQRRAGARARRPWPWCSWRSGTPSGVSSWPAPTGSAS